MIDNLTLWGVTGDRWKALSLPKRTYVRETTLTQPNVATATPTVMLNVGKRPWKRPYN